MAGQKLGSNGKFRPDPNTAKHDAEVAKLWGDGYSQREIAAHMGWANTSTVARSLDRGYQRTLAPSIESARRRSLERLDYAYRKAKDILDKEHALVSQGRVMRDDDGTPLLDDGPRLQAIDRIVKIEARVSAVLGLDAPKKVQATVVTRDALYDDMAQLLDELGVDRDAPGLPVVDGEVVEDGQGGDPDDGDAVELD